MCCGGVEVVGGGVTTKDLRVQHASEPPKVKKNGGMAGGEEPQNRSGDEGFRGGVKKLRFSMDNADGRGDFDLRRKLPAGARVSEHCFKPERPTMVGGRSFRDAVANDFPPVSKEKVLTVPSSFNSFANLAGDALVGRTVDFKTHRTLNVLAKEAGVGDLIIQYVGEDLSSSAEDGMFVQASTDGVGSEGRTGLDGSGFREPEKEDGGVGSGEVAIPREANYVHVGNKEKINAGDGGIECSRSVDSQVVLENGMADLRQRRPHWDFLKRGELTWRLGSMVLLPGWI
ncbi:hypothetical protein L1987_22919 [Smallanthus sonchifolius]|uniref:Uncharacterized protein n=1 Tax=Smallanthus sonchifolius TaxID=185202 RepID=A0ACB9IG68_9ASTR|nr:hypothetical protein L1987_22919 [Smallanthus sonchifolius]